GRRGDGQVPGLDGVGEQGAHRSQCQADAVGAQTTLAQLRRVLLHVHRPDVAEPHAAEERDRTHLLAVALYRFAVLPDAELTAVITDRLDADAASGPAGVAVNPAARVRVEALAAVVAPVPVDPETRLHVTGFSERAREPLPAASLPVSVRDD